MIHATGLMEVAMILSVFLKYKASQQIALTFSSPSIEGKSTMFDDRIWACVESFFPLLLEDELLHDCRRNKTGWVNADTCLGELSLSFH
jgi:hypothetical protein